MLTDPPKTKLLKRPKAANRISLSLDKLYEEWKSFITIINSCNKNLISKQEGHKCEPFPGWCKLSINHRWDMQQHLLKRSEYACNGEQSLFWMALALRIKPRKGEKGEISAGDIERYPELVASRRFGIEKARNFLQEATVLSRKKHWK